MAFEPHQDGRGYKNLCQQHRKPYIDHDRRVERVQDWASTHLDEIEKLMREEEKEQMEKRSAAMQAAFNAQANYSNFQAAAQQQNPYPFGGLQS